MISIAMKLQQYESIPCVSSTFGASLSESYRMISANQRTVHVYQISDTISTLRCIAFHPIQPPIASSNSNLTIPNNTSSPQSPLHDTRPLPHTLQLTPPISITTIIRIKPPIPTLILLAIQHTLTSKQPTTPRPAWKARTPPPNHPPGPYAIWGKLLGSVNLSPPAFP
jgi:hypothetical protein